MKPKRGLFFLINFKWSWWHLKITIEQLKKEIISPYNFPIAAKSIFKACKT